jgi:hypothetical protein
MTLHHVHIKFPPDLRIFTPPLVVHL